MRIGFDIRCLMEGRKTGVEEYTLGLLTHLLEIDKKNKYILFLNSYKEVNCDLSFLEKYKNVQIKRFKYPNKVLNLFFWYLRWPQIDKILAGVNVMVLPNITFGAFSKQTKLITVIHDLSFEQFSNTFSLKRKLWHIFINPRRLCKLSHKLITVSKSTKQDLETIYQIDGNKIEVIHSGVSNQFRLISRNDEKNLEVKDKYNLPYDYILYLGTMEPRKNIIGIVRAYNKLREINHPRLNRYKLVIAGAEGWKSKGILEEISASKYKKDILLIGFVDDDDKPYVYNQASIFVYPSFFEGFGFPPLEAMACGVPVITSNNSSLPEVVGRAGIMIDPDRPEEIYFAMKEILLNKKLREDLKSKGLSRAKKFNWDTTAREVLEICKGL